MAVLGLLLHRVPMDGGQLLASLLFYRNYWTAPGWYTGHFWSLAVEEHFYLIWPVLLSMAGFRRARWIAPALALAVAGWRAVDVHYGWVARLNPALAGSLARTDYRLDTLLFGCALALLWDDARVRGWLTRFGGTVLAVLGGVAAVCCQAWAPTGYLTMVAALMVLLPAATVARPRSWAGRILELPALAWLGRMSYSLYIWQQLFLPPHTVFAWQHAPWNLAALLVCAAASYYAVERPTIAFGRRTARPSHDRLRRFPLRPPDTSGRLFRVRIVVARTKIWRSPQTSLRGGFLAGPSLCLGVPSWCVGARQVEIPVPMLPAGVWAVGVSVGGVKSKTALLNIKAAVAATSRCHGVW